MNIQFIAKQIHGQKGMNLGSDVWKLTLKYLAEEHQYQWPREYPVDIAHLRKALYHVLDLHFPQDTFKGNDSEYLEKKNRLGRNWLLSLSKVIVDALPESRRPFQRPEIQLFNPRNYHMRMVKALRRIEDTFTKSGSQEEAIPDIKSFFGKGNRDNQFELKRYLASFQHFFHLNHPIRTQAHVAQRLALIAAECENQFNASIVKMQQFLSKAKSKTPQALKQQTSVEQLEKEAQHSIDVILQGITGYKRSAGLVMARQRGKIEFNKATPTLKAILNLCSNETQQAEIEQAFDRIVSLFSIDEGYLSQQFVRDHLYLCESLYVGEVVSSQELESHYWIPLKKTLLMLGKQSFGLLSPGSLIGGEPWDRVQTQKASSAEKREKPTQALFFSLRNQNPKPTLLLVLPDNALPWRSIDSPSRSIFQNEYLPVLQWLDTKYLVHVNEWIEQRDIILQSKLELEQIIRVEKKIQVLESTKSSLKPPQYQQVCEFLKNRFSLEFDPSPSLFLNQLVRKIYNQLITQINQDHPELSLEERGNIAYTHWRFVLSKMVYFLEDLDRHSAYEGEEFPLPIFEIMANQFGKLDYTLLGRRRKVDAALVDAHPLVKLATKIPGEALSQPEIVINYFQKRLQILTTHMHRLIQETHHYSLQLAQLNQQRPNFESEEVTLELIQKNIQKLISILENY